LDPQRCSGEGDFAGIPRQSQGIQRADEATGLRAGDHKRRGRRDQRVAIDGRAGGNSENHIFAADFVSDACLEPLNTERHSARI